MSIYALIDEKNNRVKQIIKNEGIFKDLPLSKRFPQEIVERCVKCDETVKEGMQYNWETNEFTEYVEEVLEYEEDEEIEENQFEEQESY